MRDLTCQDERESLKIIYGRILGMGRSFFLFTGKSKFYMCACVCVCVLVCTLGTIFGSAEVFHEKWKERHVKRRYPPLECHFVTFYYK